MYVISGPDTGILHSGIRPDCRVPQRHALELPAAVGPQSVQQARFHRSVYLGCVSLAVSITCRSSATKA